MSGAFETQRYMEGVRWLIDRGAIPPEAILEAEQRVEDAFLITGGHATREMVEAHFSSPLRLPRRWL